MRRWIKGPPLLQEWDAIAAVSGGNDWTRFLTPPGSPSPPAVLAEATAAEALPLLPGVTDMAADEQEQLVDALHACVLVPQGDASALKDFFKMSCGRAFSGRFDAGGLNCLASLLAEAWPDVLQEIGEPRALAIFGSLSGILQKMPVNGKFFPEDVYVSAMFLIAWELAGSYDIDGPKIIDRSLRADVLNVVYKILGWMASSA